MEFTDKDCVVCFALNGSVKWVNNKCFHGICGVCLETVFSERKPFPRYPQHTYGQCDYCGNWRNFLLVVNICNDHLYVEE